MRYYLYKFADNWADEMDLEGFAILTEVEKDVAEARIKKEFKRGGTICFGTNEDNEYDSLSDVLDTISFEEITKVEYDAIARTIGRTFGETGPLTGGSGNYDEDDECQNCGCDLEEDEDELCASCQNEADEEEQAEEEHNEMARQISTFIKLKFGIESHKNSSHHCSFNWKPTPKTSLEINISRFDVDAEGEIECTLRLNGSKQVGYESLEFCEISSSLDEVKKAIQHLIEKAAKY